MIIDVCSVAAWNKKCVAYCTISFNSAPSVACYQLAEILILAGPRFESDIQIFLSDRV